MLKISKSRCTFYVLLMSLSMSGAIAAVPCNTGQLEQLFNLMAERSKIMKRVAAYKFSQKGSVYDADQEIKVLRATLNIANRNQLNADKLMLFSQISMDHSKQIQEYWLSYWAKHPQEQPDAGITPGIAPLRQRIAAIDAKIYPLIAKNLPNLQKCSATIIVNEMNKAFSAIAGIPNDPDYNLILLSALKSITSAE